MVDIIEMGWYKKLELELKKRNEKIKNQKKYLDKYEGKLLILEIENDYTVKKLYLTDNNLLKFVIENYSPSS